MARTGLAHEAGGPFPAFLSERHRWFLWSPVALGAGVLIYFSLPLEPPPWLGGAFFAAALLLAFVIRRRTLILLAALAFALVAGGFALGQFRTAQVAAPVLAEEMGPGEVTGRILRAEPHNGGVRVVLEQVSIEGIAAQATPERVRMTVRAQGPPLVPGSWVSLWGVVSPPFEPVSPGAYDFARRAYFERLGGSGYAMAAARLIDPPEGAPSGSILLWINQLRHRIAERILAARESPSGPVAAALLVGERGAIGEETLVAMRHAGLAHLLAISGLHMGLVAGLIFVTLRALLALLEPLALRYPIKKWAAGASVLAAFAYLLLSGASVSTQRAFVMTGIVLLAVMLDRTSISMRPIAWAAIGVLIVAPESLLGPSFQMSFAAAMALIATWELCRAPLARWQARAARGTRPLIYLAGVAITTLVAGLATAPFAAFHFNRIADYSLIANLGAVPITAFWVMPWGIVSFALMPFGAEALALQPMGWGIDVILWIARTVSGWSGAVTLVPAMPLAAIGLIASGGIWLCLWSRPWRLFGVAAMVAGVVLIPLAKTPDILVDGNAKLFAVKTDEGGLALSSKQRARYAGEIWLRRSGQAEAQPWPKQGESAGGRLTCDGLGCIYRADGRVAALVSDPRALAEDCAMADLVVSLVPVRDLCGQAPMVVDRFDIWREGAHAFWLEEDGIRLESVGESRGIRPWVVVRGFGP